MDGVQFSPTERLDSLVELLQRRLKVLFHGLKKLLPHPGFYCSDHLRCRLLGLSVAVCCLRSPTSHPCFVSLHLQLDGPFHLWCPPVGSEVTAMTSTSDFATTALSSTLNNVSVEHDHLRFLSPHYLSDLAQALPEVGVEANFTGSSARCSQQILSIRLGLPGLSSFLPCHLIQLTTRW